MRPFNLEENHRQYLVNKNKPSVDYNVMVKSDPYILFIHEFKLTVIEGLNARGSLIRKIAKIF